MANARHMPQFGFRTPEPQLKRNDFARRANCTQRGNMFIVWLLAALTGTALIISLFEKNPL